MTTESPLSSHGAMTLVMTTLPDSEAAEKLVRALVEERLIACGNLISGVLSIFRWEGKIAREKEVLVLMKTSFENLQELFVRVAELHPYSVPEIVQVELGAVGRSYAAWVQDSSRVPA